MTDVNAEMNAAASGHEDAARNAADTAADTGRQAFGEAQKNWTHAASAGNAAFKDQAEKSLSALNELNTQGKRNLEAMVASVTAATRAAETLGAQAMAYTKTSMEKQVEAARAMTGARSMQEAVELQTTYARTAMETYVAEMNKVTETVSAAMKDTLKPLNERATAMVETVQSVR